MRDIRADPEIAELIGAEDLDLLRNGPAHGPFTCWHCGVRGDANTGPATVIVELGPGDQYSEATTVIAPRHDGAARIALAHAECSRPQIVDTGAPAPAEPRPGAGLRPMTASLSGPDGTRPLLILDRRPEMAVRTGPDEQATRYLSALVNMGLPPVTTINEELAEAMDGQTEGTSPGPWILPPAPGWRLEVSARRSARLTAPDGSVIWSGECGQPRPWREEITRTGRCVVLIGGIGFYPTTERPFRWLTALLTEAADAGELVGAVVDAR